MSHIVSIFDNFSTYNLRVKGAHTDNVEYYRCIAYFEESKMNSFLCIKQF